jgi:cytochrome c oxidase cbb3-type subunit 1
MVIMLWNTIMTVRSGKVVETPVPMVTAHA